jgi:hypothetical protein
MDLNDYGYWSQYEARVPLYQVNSFWPKQLRLFTDNRYYASTANFRLSQFRIGTIWSPTSYLNLALNAFTQVNTQSPPNEYAIEFEPSLKWSTGDYYWADRVRLDRRFLPTSAFWRFRHQLRLSYQPKQWFLTPFTSEELFLNLSMGTFIQNRFIMGTSFKYNKSTRFDVGLMLRTQSNNNQSNQELNLYTTLFFAPDLPLELDEPSMN